MGDGVQVKFCSEILRKDHNLQQLRKKDPSVVHIKVICSHVTLYEYINGGWENKNCSGPIFICQRNGVPAYKAFILNQKKFEDQEIPLIDLKVQVDDILIHIRVGDRIYGLWTSPDGVEEKKHLISALREIEKSPLSLIVSAENVSMAQKPSLMTKIDLKLLFPSKPSYPVHMQPQFNPNFMSRPFPPRMMPMRPHPNSLAMSMPPAFYYQQYPVPYGTTFHAVPKFAQSNKLIL